MQLTEERSARLMAGLKIDLGISTATIYDERLKAYIQRAAEAIEREGATLDDETVENNLIIQAYAAWLWRTRDEQSGMPRGLRRSINDMIFSQKMGG